MNDRRHFDVRYGSKCGRKKDKKFFLVVQPKKQGGTLRKWTMSRWLYYVANMLEVGTGGRSWAEMQTGRGPLLAWFHVVKEIHSVTTPYLVYSAAAATCQALVWIPGSEPELTWATVLVDNAGQHRPLATKFNQTFESL
jgi:hypothetical protein